MKRVRCATRGFAISLLTRASELHRETIQELLPVEGSERESESELWPGQSIMSAVEKGVDWEVILEGPERDRIERESLPEFLRRQRWFAGKARGLRAVRLVDAVRPEGFPESCVLTLARAEYQAGQAEVYFLPLSITSGRAAERLRRELPGRIIATLERPDPPALLYDGLADPSACEALLMAIETNLSAQARRGEIRGIRTNAYDRARGPIEIPLEVIPTSTEQSNSVVLFDHRLLLKVFRRIEPGINPDYEIGKFLSEETDFDRIPRTAGTIEYHRPDGEPSTLAVLQSLVRNQGTGWDHALRELREFYALINRADTPDDPAEADYALIGTYPAAAALLGRRTAELHRALASVESDREFAPERLTSADFARLRDRIRNQFEQSLAAMEENLRQSGFPPAVEASARRLQLEAPALMEMLDRLPEMRAESTKIRCHGDYHLGQVLRVDEDFVILDFEGEPTRPLEERRCKETAIKDVVGMLRSFDYAAYAALFEWTRDTPADFDRLVPWARRWAARTSSAFLQAYLDSVGTADFVPTDPDAFGLLLRSCALGKAAYELWYELHFRPDWVRIPIQGILSLSRQADSSES